MLRNILGTARLLTLALMLAAFASRGALAQGPTPENTVITNTATVSFTDANSNTYSSVSASVNVTVGFLAGVDVTSSTPTATPASPSSANSLNFPIRNAGNGIDTVQLGTPSISPAGGITITGYAIGATNYPTLAALNAGLMSTSLAQNGVVTVQVKYDVVSNQGGVATVLTLTANSVRTPAATDAATTTITPSQTFGVAVTPDGQAVTQLPSNGVQYTFNYTVTNNGNGADSFGLVASQTASTITIVSVNGTAGSSGTTGSIAAGGSASMPVVYTVANNAAAGTTEDLILTATSVGLNTESNAGTINLTVIRAALTMTKEAYRDNQTTLLGPLDRVVPGESIQYKVTVTNGGAANAASVVITDVMPAEVTYQSASGDASGWAFGFSGGTLTATLTGAVAPGTSRHIWIRVLIK